MLHSKYKLIFLLALLIFLFSLPVISSLLISYLPDSKISIVLFEGFYSLPFNKRTFFRFYSPVTQDTRGYLPIEVNQFLIQKIENTNDDNEVSEIIYLYALQASGHRIHYLFNLSDSAKIKVINQLVKQLDDPANLGGKLMMLEEIRSGKSLGKGSYGIENTNYPNFSTEEEYKEWFYEQSASIVIPKYQEWWNSNLSWEEKKKINPLDGTKIKVSECCG